MQTIDEAPTLAPAATESIGQSIRALRGEPLRTFFACFFVWTFVNLEQSMFAYAMPLLGKELHVPIPAIGAIISIGFLCATVGAVVVGMLTDRFGRRTMLAACFSVSSVCYALQGLAGGLISLGAARSLGAGVSAGLSPITNSFVAEVAPSRLRALMIGFLQIGFPLGWFLASMIVAPMLATFGWRSIFLTCIIGPLFAWFIHGRIRESGRFQAAKAAAPPRQDIRRQLGELFSRRYLRLTALSVLAFFAKGGAYAGLAFFLPTFLHDVRGYDTEVAVRIVGISYGIGILGYISASVVGEFWLSRRTTIVIWCWLGALALVAFVWLPTTPLQDTLAFGVTAVFSFGTAAILTTFVLEQYPTRLRATGASCASAAISLGFALMPVVVANLVGPLGWQRTITFCVAPLLIVSSLAVLGLRNVRSGEELVDS